MSNYYSIIDIMGIPGAEFKNVRLSDGKDHQCVCIPFGRIENGQLVKDQSGLRTPREYQTRDGQKKLNIGFGIELDELGDNWRAHPAVVERYKNRDMPTHQIRIALSKNDMEQRVEQLYKYYQTCQEQPAWWLRNANGYTPSEDERKRQCSYLIRNKLNIGHLFMQKQQMVQAEQAESSDIDTSMYAQAQQVTPPYEEQQPVPSYMQAPAPKPQPDLGMFGGQQQDDGLPF